MWTTLLSLASAQPYAQVLGTAQDAGLPQAGCEKSCCEAAWQGAGSRVASLALIDQGKAWLLDATPDLPEQLHELQTQGLELAGVLLTHAHIGHYTGLMHLGREAIGAQRVPVWAMPRMTTFLQGNGPWSQLVELGNIELRPMAEGQAVQLSPDLRVTPLRVPHRDEFSETVGFHVEGPERSLLYLPDIDKWERWDTPVEDWLARVDVALVDGTFYDGAELPGRDMAEIPHPFIAESMQRFASLPEDQRAKLRFVHLNHSNPAHRPDSPQHRAIVEAGMAVAQQGEVHPLGATGD